jgi:hypothetical protein
LLPLDAQVRKYLDVSCRRVATAGARPYLYGIMSTSSLIPSLTVLVKIHRWARFYWANHNLSVFYTVRRSSLACTRLTPSRVLLATFAYCTLTSYPSRNPYRLWPQWYGSLECNTLAVQPILGDRSHGHPPVQRHIGPGKKLCTSFPARLFPGE